MNDKIITLERAGINSDVVQIIFGEGAELPASFPQVEQTFRNCFKKNDVQLIINMVNIKFPPTKFIALLIEITNQARRLGGDVKLINVSNSARNNLVTFSAFTYLSIEDSEIYALNEFGEKTITLSSAEEKNEATKNKLNALDKIETKNEVPIKSDNFMLDADNIKVKSKIECLYEICDFVINLAEKAGFDNREIGKIKVTVYEACLNVIEHAYFSNPENWIEVSISYDAEKFVIVIHDWGQGFEFDPSQEYNVEQAVKDRQTGGFGLHIIQRSVDDVKYETDPKLGNKLTLVKYLNNERVMIK